MIYNKGRLQHLLKKSAFFIIAVSFMILSAVSLLAETVGESETKQTDIAVSVTGVNADLINSYLEKSLISIRTAKKDDTFLLNLDTVFSGENVLRVLFELSKDKAAFSVPDYDDNRYEFDLAELAGLLQSVYGVGFDPGLISLAGNEELVSYFTGLSEEFLLILTPYFDYLTNTVTEGMQKETGEITLSHLGAFTDGNIFTWEPDAQELAGIMKELAEMIENDESAKEFVDRLASALSEPDGIGAAISQAAASAGEYVNPMELGKSLTDGFASAPSFLREGAKELAENGMNGEYIRISECKTETSVIPCKLSLQIGTEQEMQFDCGFERDPVGPGQSACLYFETPQMEGSLSYCSELTEDELIENVLTVKVFSVPVFLAKWTEDEPAEPMFGRPVKEVFIDCMGVTLSLALPDEEDRGPVHLSLQGIGKPDDPAGINGFDITVSEVPAEGDIEEPSGTVRNISNNYDMRVLSMLFDKISQSIEQRVMQTIMSAQ